MLVDPPTQTVSGPTVSVDIKIAGVVDLGSYGFTLSWDETVLSFVSVTDGIFLGSTGRTVNCPAPVIGVNSVAFGCNTTGVQPGPNGAGILATVEFGTVGPGTSPAALSGVTLTDTSGTPLGPTTNDGTITVQLPTATPTATPTPTVTATPTPTPTPTATFVPSAVWYLHNNPAPPTGDTVFQAVLPIDQTAPSAATLFNYDIDRDAFPGLFIQKGGIGLTEVNPQKFQVWRTAPLSADLTITGPMLRLVLWSGVKDFTVGVAGSVTVFLRHFDGTGYTEIGQGSRTNGNWGGGSTTWVSRGINIAVVNYTIPAGDYLEIKLIVDAASEDDMWFAYDTTSYDSRLELP